MLGENLPLQNHGRANYPYRIVVSVKEKKKKVNNTSVTEPNGYVIRKYRK
jgi:predicted amidohydrolase